MGLIHVEVDLVNGGDMLAVRHGQMDRDDVRHIGVLALVDSGCMFMAINENIQAVLQLPVVGKHRGELANGLCEDYDIVAPIEVRYDGHVAHCSAVVLPGNSEPLLGAIPMEEMNVIIDPQRQELTVNPRPYRI